MKNELATSKNESPTKKLLLLIAVILAVLCTIFLLQSANEITANAAQTGTVISKKLLEDNTYINCGSSGLVSVFGRNDNTAYKVVRYDGKIVTIDNSDGQIRDMYPYSSTGVGYQLLVAHDSNDKKALLDYDGNYLAEEKEFYDDMGLLNQEHNKDYYYRVGTSLYICAEDGTMLYRFVNLPEDIYGCEVVLFGNNYGINYRSDHKFFYGIIDREGNPIRKGKGWVTSTCLTEAIYNETTGDFERYVFYDTELNQISERIWGIDTYHDELAPNVKFLEESEIPSALSELDIDAMITIGDTMYYRFWGNKGYGLVDSNGNKVFPLINNFIGDRIIAVKDENGYYNAIELSSVSTGVTSICKQADGSMTAALIAAGTTDTLFELNAPKDTISDGCIFKVTKLENTDKAVANAKTLLKEKMNEERFTAYDISLLNSANEKVQPKGTLSITTSIPNGYAADKLAIYRINDDNTCTELKSTISGNNVTFETDHFSTYVIAEKAVATSPKTGDTSFEVLWFILLLSAVTVLCNKRLWKQV